jgi:hypothetical protein
MVGPGTGTNLIKSRYLDLIYRRPKSMRPILVADGDIKLILVPGPAFPKLIQENA